MVKVVLFLPVRAQGVDDSDKTQGWRTLSGVRNGRAEGPQLGFKYTRTATGADN